MSFPREPWAQIVSSDPLERVNREVKRRTGVIGVFPNDDAIVRLVDELMPETNDESAVARRYMSLETLACLIDDLIAKLTTVAAWSSRPAPDIKVTISASYTTPRGTIAGATTPGLTRARHAVPRKDIGQQP